jgi:mono/diheme cytochrome c family protein
MASAQKIMLMLSALFACSVVPASAQGLDIGQREYNSHCAFCHGRDGKGDGPSANMLRTKVADLTVLQKNNNDVFPFKRTYEVIDGREAVVAHGPRDMPIWGEAYSREATDWNLPPGISQETFIRARILALVEHISRLQEK